jgi:CBS domain-containing protein
MPQARDIMTGSLTTCSLQASVAKAAQLMRDRNIGDVLVTDEGKLVGILTDRDIAVRVTAKTLDPKQVPVCAVMSSHVQTGKPNWDLDQIAQTMGKRQVHRLPIVENGIPVGIVSFSDIVRHHNHNSHIVQSLRELSEPSHSHRLQAVQRGGLLATLGVGLVATAAVALTLSPKAAGKLRGQVQPTRTGNRHPEVIQAERNRNLDRMKD